MTVQNDALGVTISFVDLFAFKVIERHLRIRSVLVFFEEPIFGRVNLLIL